MGKTTGRFGFSFVYVCVLLLLQRNRMKANPARTLFFPDNTRGPRKKKKVKNTWVKNINSAKKIQDGR